MSQTEDREHWLERNGQRGTYVEQQRSQARRQYSRETLQETLDAAYQALADHDRQRAGDLAVHLLHERTGITLRNIGQAASKTRAADGAFHNTAVRRMLRDPDAYRNQPAAVETARSLQRDEWLTTVRKTLESLSGYFAATGQLKTDATSTVPAWEYSHQVGERYYSPLSAGRDELEMVDEDGDWKATLLTGGQGSGKSSTGFTIAEDRIAEDHKIIDLIDMFKAENAMYDVESRHDDLDDMRRDAAVDAGFADPVEVGCGWLFDDVEPDEDAYLPPNVEILLPLTHELADSEVPFDTHRDEFTALPFAIPASDLTYRQLVMLLPHTTKTQENYLRSAHQMLTERGTDWTLRDVAETVRRHTNAGESVADRIERSLETAQSKSFIRDEQSDHCIDWQRIMADRDTVTSFSTYMIREKSDKLAITSWLLDSLYQARLDLLRKHAVEKYPPLTVMMREAHKVAPRQKAEQDAEATIEGDMIDTFSELIALMRHVNMEIVADTQKFHQQLSPSVSGLFHRVFAFSGQKPDIKQVFKTRVDTTGPAQKVAKYDPGKCALVSGDGYSMPIQMLPPRMHHLDAKHDGDGLGARATYLDHEELREAPWDSEIPPRLRFNDMERGPVAEFVYQHVEQTGSKDDYVTKKRFTELFNDWYLTEFGGGAEKHHNSVCQLIKRKTNFEDAEPVVDGGQQACWVGIIPTYDPAAGE